MCGIVGIAGPLSRERLNTTVAAMNCAVNHRGPDDEGGWIGEDFAFAMRRLSIIDLAGGRQPMWDQRSGLGIVYNGEVYNYRALRCDLEKAGIGFQTMSDTEVVLKSLALKGSKAVHDWNGMFAVAAWNPRDRKLLLVRDRMGIKPLYYYWDGATLMFASEIKAFLATAIFPKCVNRQAISDYLTYRYVPGPETIWRNVWKLPPGHMLEWSPGRDPRVTRYWKTDVISLEETVDIERKTAEFETLFLDSVQQRLLASDVPVGVMLSGGLDSSCVAAAAVELGHKEFHTFSVAFSEGGEFSELAFAREVADHLGVHHHEVVVDRRGFIEMLPEAVRAADEPLADLTIVPLLAISRLARERVKVVLSGEGGDEVLAGYGFDEYRRKIEMVKRLQMLPAVLLKALSRTVAMVSDHYGSMIAKVATTPLAKWNVENRNHMTWEWSEVEKSELWPGYAGRDSYRILNAMYAAAKSEDPVDQILSVFQQSWLVEDLLMKADKMSMAASLELRVPFLDHRLVEWANRQAIDVKLGRSGKDYVTKYVLRRFADKRLPGRIIDRPKRGFPVPVYDWVRDPEFGRWMRDHLLHKRSTLKNVFDSRRLEQHLDQAAVGSLRDAHKCWLLIVLETWCREWNVDLARAS